MSFEGSQKLEQTPQEAGYPEVQEVADAANEPFIEPLEEMEAQLETLKAKYADLASTLDENQRKLIHEKALEIAKKPLEQVTQEEKQYILDNREWSGEVQKLFFPIAHEMWELDRAIAKRKSNNK